MRLALLSNVTVEVLAGMLGKEHDLWCPPGFGAWMETALDVPADLRAFDPDAVIILLDFHFAPPPSDLEGSLETAVAALETALPRSTVVVPDLEDLASDTRMPDSGRFHDAGMWRIASMPWSMGGLRAIRDEVGRLLRAMGGGCRKVLALDFDNTLWKGVIGEDGVSGIEPFADFQRGILKLRERGVLLVGLSRNNAADVEPVWSDPRMVLKREDFADLRIDWNGKAENLAEAARTLNLGTDAFVFVDDDPVERARMSALLPEVAVQDATVGVRRLTRLHFPRLRVTAEDRRRTELYRAESKRREDAARLPLDTYLKSLEIRTEIHPAVEGEFVRVAQLSQKSNQFNVCSNRRSADDVARFAGDPAHLLATVRVSDRYGDLGLVAFVHCAPAAEPRVCEIADWVMSCRAMNRRVEFAVQRWVEDELRRRGVTELRATWRRTAKNAPVRNLFETFGFRVIRSSEDERRYAKALARF